jgi:hypothetical protein
LLVPDFTIFRLATELGWRNGLSSGSFPQFDVSVPRPSRLSEGVLGKIPTDKEAQQEHTLKRLTHNGFPDGARRSAALVAKSGHHEPDLLIRGKGPSITQLSERREKRGLSSCQKLIEEKAVVEHDFELGYRNGA